MHKLTWAFFICVFALSSAAVYGGGRQDNESHTAGDPSGFTESVNIENKNPGKWNFYLEARDKGGNTTLAGPHNVYIDPESDLPVTRVINPLPNMHVKGNLNIVGTCADDDGVAYVELEITRGKDGKGESVLRTRAEGTDFWSYFLDTADTQVWHDGIYTVSAWGVDINGLSGISDVFPEKSQKMHQVVWNLDRKKPEITVTSHDQGALLKGKVSIKGTVWDGNGIDSLSYSLNNGIYYLPVKLKYDKKTGISHFDITVDTRSFTDGAAVILLKARDKMSSEGILSFLTLVNNTGPDVQIIYPALDETVNGIFTVAGYAMHNVGLASLSWKLGKESGELPLIPGNPWWVKEFDIRGQKVKNLDLELRAVDFSGNVTVAKRRLRVAKDISGRELSTAEYSFPADDTAPNLRITESPDWVQNQLRFKFTVADATRIKSVDYNINADSSWQPLLQGNELSALRTETEIERTLDISALEDGMVTVAVRIIDEENQETVKYFSTNKDTKAPEVRLIVPVSGARVNGTIRMGIAISDAGKIDSVVYERPASGIDVPAISKTLYSGSDAHTPLTFLDVVLDSVEMPLSPDMRFVFTDAAGNTSTLSEWPFIIERETDLPVVQISLPLEDEIIVADFVISGVVYDDDDVKNIYWRLDNGDVQILETKRAYSIAVPLSSMTDNEHSVSIYAEDIFGVTGHIVNRNFRVSLEEPKASFTQPALGEIVGGMVTIAGVASDKNGIKSVQISLDNGNSFNDAVIAVGNNGSGGTNNDGAVKWTYQFNSKIIQDGPHVVFLRVWDKYDISSLYSSMLMVDNTPPELVLDTPVDGAVTTGPLYFTGHVIDAIMLESVTIKLNSLERVVIPPELAVREIKTDALLLEGMDISSLPNGSYNVEIWATDKAGNANRVSRNITLAKDKGRNFIDLLYPLNGEHVQGYFNLYGYAGGIDTPGEVTLLVNDTSIKTEAVSETGYFRFAISADDLAPGENKIVVSSDFGGAETALSATRIIQYQPLGPWITVDTMNMGDFAYERPWLMGRTGYVLSDEERAVLADKKVKKELKAAVETKKVESIELSFDNGRTFSAARKSWEENYNWRYRIEDWEMKAGIQYLVVRANMRNGEKAVTRFLIQIDNTPPEIRLISPEQGGRYNAEMQFAALVSDDVELKNVSYHLRQGDKATYEVPGFLKGLYVENTIPPFLKQAWNGAPGIFNGGATYMDFGLGLSFFDDNVKIQAVYGFMTQSLYAQMGGWGQLRYGGQVLGVKLLANIYTLSFGKLAGPDWNWLYASFTMGANFSLFDIAKEGYTQSGNPTWMSALLAQIEFPKVTIPQRSRLRTFSLFTEGQLWFVPTDVNAKKNNLDVVKPHLVMGLRMYVF